MDNNRYGPIFEQAKTCEKPGEQNKFILTILELIAMNHLPTIERRIKRLEKWLLAGLAVIIAAILFGNQLSIEMLVKLIGKMFWWK